MKGRNKNMTEAEEKRMKQIIKQIALKNNKTVEEVRSDMEEAIKEAWNNRDEQTKKKWEDIGFRDEEDGESEKERGTESSEKERGNESGRLPTVEEFIYNISMKVNKQ